MDFSYNDVGDSDLDGVRIEDLLEEYKEVVETEHLDALASNCLLPQAHSQLNSDCRRSLAEQLKHSILQTMAYKQLTGFPLNEVDRAKEQGVTHLTRSFTDFNGNKIEALATQELQDVSIQYRQWINDETAEVKVPRIVVTFLKSGVKGNFSYNEVKHLLTEVEGKDGQKELRIATTRLSYDAMKQELGVDEVEEEAPQSVSI